MSSSSPPSSSSSPSLSSPFSRLPFELVQQIIESSVPRNFHSTTYRDRQDTLLSLCLVSRLFHQISKPLLFAVVRVRFLSEQGKLWSSSQAEGRGGTSPTIRELVFIDANTETTLFDFKPALQDQLNLTRLVLNLEGNKLNIAKLSHLNHLSALSLDDLHLTASKHFVFPNLSELNFSDVTPAKSWTSKFSLHCFPSVRALSVSVVLGDNDSHNLALHVLRTFAPQVQVIALKDWEISRIPADLFDQIKHKTLIDVPIDRLRRCPHIPYLRLVEHEKSTTPSLESLFKSYDQLPSTVAPLLLYLDSHFDSTLQVSSDSQDPTQSFVEYWAARKVKVIPEEQPYELGIDREISQDFWERMKEKTLQ